MKRLIFSSLIIGLMLASLSSCDDKNISGFTSKDNSSSSVLEPSFNWGCNASTLKSEMNSKGFTYSSQNYDDGYTFCYFTYGSLEYECSISGSIGYWNCFCQGITASRVKEIMTYYSNSSNYTKLGEKYYGEGKIYAFQTKDNKTFIYAQAMDDDSCIIYYSKTLDNSWESWLELF